VGKGNVDLGITGHDVVLESEMQDLVVEELRLGFGKCSLQVQVPENSSIKTVDDLAGKRVVTSFEVLAGQYFKEVDTRLQLPEDQKTKIEYVGGSVEAACSLGLADGIGESNHCSPALSHPVRFLPVDLVGECPNQCSLHMLIDVAESGDTMRAAGLHAIATVLKTEAVLIKSAAPKHPHLQPLIDVVTRRIEGVIAASKHAVCQFNVPRDKLAAATAIAPGRRAPTVSPIEEENWVAVSVMVEKSRTAEIMDELMAVGAEDILIFNLDNCRV